MTRSLLLLGLLCSNTLAADARLKTETFDRDPGWEGHNNHIVPKNVLRVTQDFGFSATNHAGKAAGEIGGRIQRSTTPANYAAEIPAKTLDDKFSASGSFAVTKTEGGAGVFFGFFNSQQPGGSGRPIGSLGLDFDFEGTGGRLATRLITGTNKSCGTFITPYLPGKFRPTPIRNDGTRYHWTLAYDPQGAGGNGQFTFTMLSDTHTSEDYGTLPENSKKEAQARFPNTTTFTVDLTPGFRKEGATFDRFGVLNMMKSGGAATMFFDDVMIDGRSEDFTRDPSWAAVGNRTTYEDHEVVGAHDFGFSTKTNHAGGKAPGEVGGGLWRSGEYGYYADRIGPLNLEQRLEARGKVKLVTAGPDSDMHIGWFSSASKNNSPDEAGNFIGIHVGGPTRIGHYFIPQFATSTGTKGKVDSGPVLTPGKLFDWSLVYDPAAGGGNGEMRVTLGAESATLALKPGQKKQGATLDRFGLFTSQAGGQMVKIFLDDLSYTAEPLATVTLTPVALKPSTTSGLPKVVLLGDSVREHYAPFVAELLAGKATVVTPKTNGGDTGKLLTNLNEWAIKEQPDLVHFNSGIHDTKRDQKTGKYNVLPEKYEANLREIVKRLRAETKAKLAFALSTPLIDERSKGYWKTRSYQLFNASVMDYNVIALRVMKELDVPVNDLPAALGDAKESARLHDGGGIHFTEEGSRKLAAVVAAAVIKHLPEKAGSK